MNIPDLPNMPEIPKEIAVECHSALSGDTQLLVDNQMINMRQLHLGYSGRSVSTFAVNNSTALMDNCHILEIPEEVYTSSIVRLRLHYGQYLECAPGTLILTPNGDFVPAGELKKNDKVKVMYFNLSSGNFFMDDGIIVSYELDPALTLQMPVYLFISEYENILLPYYREGAEVAAFINVLQ